MPDTGIVLSVNRLTHDQLAQVKELEKRCNEYDSITLKLNWDMLENRKAEECSDWLYVEDGKAVGFLALFAFKSSEAEISGMVDPEYRRRGIFRKLFEAAAEECRKRGIPEQLLIVQRGSESGRSFAGYTGAAYEFSEYWMELPSGYDRDVLSSVISAGQIQLRPAEQADMEVAIRLDVAGFGVTESDARGFNEQKLAAAGESFWIAELEGTPIGKINIQLYDGGFISGFCVLPEYRGQGHGRVILGKAISIAESKQLQGKLALEVAANNDRALGLYKSVGFVERSVNDYYRVTVG
ncbi:GNAT family N-acetyltransferase [Paenibacillus chitinolyticus]|uniref:GNAT family N-acetyltransferase n=1 Tax=Paenibacillus chitinolyticus TaxID=79263 RepID=UPI002DBC44D8|nr:GNAT family N-acetyltransferase [Paenibacillus chitinolyticus]MEC0247331.1 GNAT family N-acetyltransferase [Paenibacillus chitinolyticus]